MRLHRMIGAYREPDGAKGRHLVTRLIDSLSRGVPAALTELITLGRTLKKRAEDVLAYFSTPPAPATGRRRRSTAASSTCGSALDFRNLANYIARSLSRPAGSGHDYTRDHKEPRTVDLLRSSSPPPNG